MNNLEKLQLAKNERINKVSINNQGLKMEIIDYKNKKDITVKLEDGYVANNREYGDFEKGTIKSPYFPTIYNKGYIGVGNIKATKNGKDGYIYTKWINMFKRCYDEKSYIKHPTYADCDICEEWYNFQTFAKWVKENTWDSNFNIIDKDILMKNNKIYNPSNCIMVDVRINSLFTNRKNHRGDYPIGVYYKNNKYISQCSIYKDGKYKQLQLGCFNNQYEAFNAYKEFKENYIKQIADEYNKKYCNFPQKLYNAMYSYKIEITD